MHMKRTADRLFGRITSGPCWALGVSQLPIAAMGAAMAAMCASASKIRSGSAAASLRSPNAAQVTQVRKIIEGLGLEIATPVEARRILQLNGGRQGVVLITMMLRSMLFAPGDSQKNMDKAAASPADAVIFDLEDSVVPEAKPARARRGGCLFECPSRSRSPSLLGPDQSARYGLCA